MNRTLLITLLLSSQIAWAECDVKSASAVSASGQFSSESITICREGQKVERKIRAGDLILETEVGRSKVDLYFKYQNMRCRNFTEQYFEIGVIKRYYGVICQANPNDANWMVMDKW
jgi:hypothetical protein